VGDESPLDTGHTGVRFILNKIIINLKKIKMAKCTICKKEIKN